MSRLFKTLFTIGLSAVAAGCVVAGGSQAPLVMDTDIVHLEDDARQVVQFLENKRDELPECLARDEEAAKSATALALTIRGREQQILALKQAKRLGEDNRGYVALRSTDGLSDETTNELQQLTHAENSDRKDLYNQVALLSGHDVLTLTLIERAFAIVRLRQAGPGMLHQLPQEGPDFDEIQRSRIGKRLGDVCQPGAWVAIR